MILESHSLVHKATELDAIMGCELCGRRIETSYAWMVEDMELCHECTRAYNMGFIDGKWAGIRKS